MKEKTRNYLLEYIDTLLSDNQENNKRILLMKHNHVLFTKLEDIQCMGIEKKGYQIIYHNYEYSNMRKPYEPFLDVIKEFLGKKMQEDSKFQIENFIEKAEVYSLHKPIFKHYFQTGSCERLEEMIVGEYEYEKKKFQNAVLNMLNEMAREKPIFILLNELNLAGSSIFWMIEEILKKRRYNRIKIMAVFNEVGEILPFAKEDLKYFIHMCEDNDIVCNWLFDAEEDVSVTSILTERKMPGIISGISTLKNMLYAFEFKQAVYYLENIFERIETEKIEIKPEQERELLNIYFWISLSEEEYSYALLLCDMLNQLKFYDAELQQKVKFESEYFKTLVHLYNENITQMQEGVFICERIAKQINCEKSIFKVKILKNMSCYSGWKNLWICEKNTDVEEELIQQCIKYQYKNHLAHIYVYSFNNDYHNFVKIEGIEERISNFNKGIAIGKELKNEQFLLEAYRKNIMLASIHGYFPVCIYFYEKALKIVKKSKDEIAEASIYNGLGYSNCGLEHYEQAKEYYNKALLIYQKHRLSDEIVETLYNMGINSILAEDYEYASAYLLEAANILRILKQSTLRTCNISKLFGLIALSCFYQKVMYRAYLYLNNAKQFLAHILGKEEEEKEYFSDDSMFLVYFVDGLIKISNHELEEALKYFQKAEFYMERSTGAKFFNYPQLAIAKYELFVKLDRKEEAKEILLACRAYCRENHYIYREQKIDELLGEKIPEQKKIKLSKMDLKGISLHEISESMKKKSEEKEKKSMVKTIRFFNILQKFTNQMLGTVKEEVSVMLPVFKNNFYLDKVFLIRCREDKNEVMYSDLGFEISDKAIEYIVTYFKEKPEGFVVSKNGVDYEEYDKIVSLFYQARIFSFAAVPIFEKEELNSVFIAYIEMKDSWISKERSILDQSDLEIFTYVFRQISNAIEKLEVRKKLVQANEQLKQQMEQLIELKNEAEAANEAKSIFLANMSHEIRTPMNAIIGMAEIALRGDMSQEQRENIRQIQSAGKSLLLIINDILDFSKIESGKMELLEENYQLEALLAEVKSILTERIGSKELKLKLMVNQDIPQYLHGDDVKIRQVIINLGNNAIKFTQKGEVVIAVDYEADGENIKMRVSVKDTGIGIKPENQKKLFTSFQQVDSRQNRKIEGTGLGLSISKALISLMGGSISVISEYGKGSEFSFVIPQKVTSNEEITHNKEKSKEKAFIAPTAKILIVDDNQINLKVAEGLLQPFKMQIETASSGIQAIEMLQENPTYDMIFMDHMMPDMDGIETMKKIKELHDNYYQSVPIVALTANAVSGVKEMFLANGMSDFLTKPIDMQKMKLLLKKWLPKNKIYEEASEKVTNKESISIETKKKEEKIMEIKNLDIEQAIRFSGTIEVFMKLLQVFYDTLPAKVSIIEKYEKEENIHDYTIEVHALKSAAKLIGATELSKQAEYLEECGKEENIFEIHEKTPALTALYRSYEEQLKPYVK